MQVDDPDFSFTIKGNQLSITRQSQAFTNWIAEGKYSFHGLAIRVNHRVESLPKILFLTTVEQPGPSCTLVSAPEKTGKALSKCIEIYRALHPHRRPTPNPVRSLPISIDGCQLFASNFSTDLATIGFTCGDFVKLDSNTVVRQILAYNILRDQLVVSSPNGSFSPVSYQQFRDTIQRMECM